MLFEIYDVLYKNGKARKMHDELNSLFWKDKNKGQKLKLNAIIHHALATTDYYSKFKTAKCINDFPVLKKDQLKSNLDLFLSSLYKQSEIQFGFTSGSTGSPMKYYYDKLKKEQKINELIYFNGWAGYLPGMKHILNSIGSRKSKTKLWLQNQIIFDPSKLSKNKLAEFRDTLINKRIKFYVAYPSVLREIANYCFEMGDGPSRFNLKGIIATGEPLSSDTRNLAESVFGCKVLSRYSALEFGVLAQECPEGYMFHLNTLNYYFEVLKVDQDIPADPGEAGRLIITDLHNYMMPLLRYEIGDLAIMDTSHCSCGRKGFVISSLQGRIVDYLLDSLGNKVSFAFLNTLMWPYHENIIRYQFIQDNRLQVILLLQVTQRFPQEKDLKAKLGEALGYKTEIIVKYVDYIPAFESGKKPFVVNNLVRKKN